MALSERLQILIESLGGSKVVGDFTKIGAAGKAEFDKVAGAGDAAAARVAAAQARMATTTEAANAKMLAANQRLEVAQLKASQASSAVERAQLRVGETAAGTTAAAVAGERLEAAELRAAQAGSVLSVAQERVAATTASAAAAMGSATAELTAATVAEQAASAATVAGSGLASEGLAKLGLSGATTGGALAAGVTAGAAAAGLALAAFVKSGLSEISTVDGQVRKLRASLGSTAEEAAKLRNVAANLGIDPDALNKGLVKLSINLEKTQGDLAGVHVETARNADGTANMVATLDNVRAAYQAIEDPQQRNIFLTAALAKGGIELRGVLSSTNDEYARLGRSGPAPSAKELAESRALAISQREASQAVAELKIELARGLVPVLTEVAQDVTTVVRGVDSLASHVGGVGRVVSFTVDSLKRGALQSTVGQALSPVLAGLRLLGDRHKDAGAGAASQAEDEATLAASLADVAAASEKVAAGRSSLVDLQIGELDRTSAATTAQESLAGAEAKLADLRVSSAEEGARAKEEYASRVSAVNAKVADSEAKLADAHETASKRVVAAQKAATEANESAHQSTRDAERALSDLRKNQAAAGNPALATQLARSQATSAAVSAVDRARAREADVAASGTESVAKAGAEGATSVATATKDLATARAEQNKLAAEGAELAKAAVRRERDIADAVKDVARARSELATAQRSDAEADAKASVAKIEAALAIEGHTVTATEHNELLAQQYDAQAAKLAADSPLRKNLREWAEELRGLVLDIDVRPFLASLDAAVAGLPKLQHDVDTAGPGGGRGAALAGATASLPGRLAGGPVMPGVAYRVGEEGEEILVMHANGGGYVYPHAGGRAGGGPVGRSVSTAQFTAAVSAGAGGAAFDYDKLAAALVRATSRSGAGETNHFTFHGVQPGTLPSELPRMMRKQRYLTGLGR